MAAGDELMQIAEAFHLPIITIDDVIHFRKAQAASAAPLQLPVIKAAAAS
jgi:hypothetical protein